MTILLSLAAAITVAVSAFVLMIGSTDTPTSHACHAPCVVTFDQPMAEDNFKIDYRPGGTVKVWKEQQ